MNSSLRTILVILSLFTALPSLSFAQAAGEEATVNVFGEVLTPFNLTLSSLKEYTQVTVIRKDKDGKDHSFNGVLLADILQKAGVTLGKALRGKNLTKYLLVEASDGYQVLFSLAELDAGFTDRKIILCTQMDGQPLPVADGPFRIIVQDEKVPARCAKQVIGLQVKFAQ
jgi:DMSO/TMAO reductase YedYZ molybdopterin-dependent catalytic subunit